MKELTDKQLKELIRIVRDNQNINDRWVALSKDPINQELKFAKADFLSKYGLQDKSVEGRIRDHVQANQKVNLRALRKELDPSKDISQFQHLLSPQTAKADSPPSLTVAKPISNPPPYSSAAKADISSGTVAFFVALGVIAVLVSMMYRGGESDLAETVAERDVSSELDICMQVSGFERSCRTDPEFTYCSIAFENQIGSGCTSRIRGVGGQVEQGQFCIEQLAPIIRQQCAIEIYGCAAVTGNVNC